MVMFSYGSGLSATMFSFQIREGQHPFSLSNIATVMNVGGKMKSRHEVSFFLDFQFNSAASGSRICGWFMVGKGQDEVEKLNLFFGFAIIVLSLRQIPPQIQHLPVIVI